MLNRLFVLHEWLSQIIDDHASEMSKNVLRKYVPTQKIYSSSNLAEHAGRTRLLSVGANTFGIFFPFIVL